MPAQNEEGSVGGHGRGVIAALEREQIDPEVIVIKDDSEDSTKAVVNAIGAENPRVRCHRPHSFKLANSIAGMPQSATQGPAWLVLPTYNEAGNIESFVAAARRNLPASAQILIVDDNSPDGTGEIADRLAAADARTSVLHRPHKEGLGPAYIAGFRHALAAGAGFVLEMDSDFSHDPEALPRLLEAAKRTDLVIGSRYVPGGSSDGWSALRLAISRGGSVYARLILGLRVRDLTGGFKCFRREILEAIDLDSVQSKGYAFQVEMTYRAIQLGFDVVEIPIVFRDREVGVSKMSRAIIAEAVWRLPLLRLQKIRAVAERG